MRRVTRLLAIAPIVAASAATTPALASEIDPKAVLGLTTTAYFSGPSITFVANGSFDGGIVDNSAVALQAAGTETWIDARGVPHEMPFECHGAALRFSNVNTVTCTARLQSEDSIVSAVWTAEAAGLAPTPFVGTCAGEAVRSGGTQLIIPTC